jgi:hypothetical protein
MDPLGYRLCGGELFLLQDDTLQEDRANVRLMTGCRCPSCSGVSLQDSYTPNRPACAPRARAILTTSDFTAEKSGSPTRADLHMAGGQCCSGWSETVGLKEEKEGVGERVG